MAKCVPSDCTRGTYGVNARVAGVESDERCEGEDDRRVASTIRRGVGGGRAVVR